MKTSKILIFSVFFTCNFIHCVLSCKVLSPGDVPINASQSAAIVEALKPLLSLNPNFEQADINNSRNSPESLCQTELEMCKSLILKANESYYTADACGTFNQTLACLQDIFVADCSLSQDEDFDFNQRLANVHANMESLCGEYYIAKANADRAFRNCACWTRLRRPVQNCANRHSENLFGPKPSPSFCCDYMKYEDCVRERVQMCHKDVFRELTANHFKALYNNGSLAGNVDECIETQQQC